MTEGASDVAGEIARRRTFAIISHPDAGKTTLTERLLRAGGAIQLAGNVRAKGERRRTRSDWMGIERDRGISVVTSVMTFEHAGCVFNLLDTPGHEDFSEDTYRTLTAVDSAVMVIDAAKGIEARTRKLFEICRLRDIPIITFVNKMDRESRDPFDLLDEVASTLALDTAPVTWPVGRGSEFVGTYDLRSRALHLTQELAQADPRLQALGDEADLVRAALPEFEVEPFAAGHLTPVFFGSAIKEIGVMDLLDALASFGPQPRAQPADTRVVEATEPGVVTLASQASEIAARAWPRGASTVTLDDASRIDVADGSAGITVTWTPGGPAATSATNLTIDVDTRVRTGAPGPVTQVSGTGFGAALSSETAVAGASGNAWALAGGHAYVRLVGAGSATIR